MSDETINGNDTHKPSMPEETLGDLKTMAAASRTAQDTRDVNKDRAVSMYLQEHLPASEQRIEVPQDPRCEIAIVLPAYAEGNGLLRPLSSLAAQEGISPEQFEVIVVVNNSSEMPARTSIETDTDYQRKQELHSKSLADNQLTLQLISAIQAGQIPEGLDDQQRLQARIIIERGIRVFAIDKSTGAQALPPESANVGTARDRGVAEVVERFRKNGKDGIIAQSDSDVAFDSQYLANLVRVFADNPDVVGVAGSLRFEKTAEVEALFPPIVEALQDAYQGSWDKLLYEKLGRQGERFEENPEEVRFSGASMSSRAFAAAEAGGVPHIAGGEDPAFSRALKKVGEVIKDGSVIARPEARLSARTEVGAGHGQRLLAAADTLREGGLKVPNPDSIMVYVDLRANLAQHLAENAASLAPLMLLGKELLSTEMMDTLRHVASESSDVDSLLARPELAEIRQIIQSSVDNIFQKVSIIEATDRIVAIAADTPEKQSIFNTELAQLSRQEQEQISKRISLVQNLFAITSELPQRYYSSADIANLLSERQEVIGLSNEQLQQVVLDQSILRNLAEIASNVRNSSDGVAAMASRYFQELTPLEQNPQFQALIKLWAINKVS